MAELTKKPKDFELVNNTATKTVKDNVADKIDIEIGDALQPDFKPQFKIKRWDNEVNFSMRAEEDPDATTDVEGDVVKYKAKDFEVHMYEKPEVAEDGGFEFEWVLPKKPKTNILAATIQAKELDFLYQPALTAEEIAEGASRPENVEGSYAVYHKTKKNNKVGGKEYKTGKAFHIYRPEAIDADGARTWCELNITDDTLTVTVPQEWLDGAVYPVVVDPTFGYTSLGASAVSIARYRQTTLLLNSYRRGQAATGVAGTLQSISAFLKTTKAESIDITAFLSIEDSAGANSHGEVAEIEKTNVSLAVHPTYSEETFTASGETLSAQEYVLNIVANGSDLSANGTAIDYVYIGADSGGSYSNGYVETFTGSSSYTDAKSENPWSVSLEFNSNRLSIYATYTEASSARRRILIIS